MAEEVKYRRYIEKNILIQNKNCFTFSVTSLNFLFALSSGLKFTYPQNRHHEITGLVNELERKLNDNWLRNKKHSFNHFFCQLSDFIIPAFDNYLENEISRV